MRNWKRWIVIAAVALLLCACSALAGGTAQAAGKLYEGEYGSAKFIGGTTVIVSIFANDATTSWNFNNSDDLQVYSTIHKRMGIGYAWLEKQIARYGVTANIVWDWMANSGLYYTANFSESFINTFSEANTSDRWTPVAKYIERYIDSEGIMRAYGADNIVYAVHLNGKTYDDYRAYAYGALHRAVREGEAYYEICFFPPSESRRGGSASTFVHELLHCFGAPDLYLESDFVPQQYADYLERINSKDIMYIGDYYVDKVTLRFTDVDAYYLGLIDAPAEVAKWGLGESTFTKWQGTPVVRSASFQKSTVGQGESAKATVVTTANTKYLRLLNASGTTVETWQAAGNSRVMGGTRIWTVSHAFKNAGPVSVSFAASANNRSYGMSLTTSINVTGPTVRVTGVTGPSSAVVGTGVSFTVRTSSAAQYLRMYNTEGSVVNTWQAAGNSTVDGSERVWNVQYAFKSVRKQTLTFRASSDSFSYGDGKTAEITIQDIPKVRSVQLASQVIVKTPVTITAKTPASAQYLRMFNSEGAVVKTWKAEGNSAVEDQVRTWKVTFSFQSIKKQTLSFRASADGKTYGDEKTASIQVVGVPKVTSVSISSEVVVGAATTITAKTPAVAQYLQMCNAEGTVIKTWKAAGNSTVSGDTRTWSVPHTFKSVRSQTLTFQASGDNKTYGTGKTAEVTVVKAKVTHVTIPASIVVGTETTITAKTQAGARYLQMCNAEGTVVKTWKAEGNSTVSGNTRTWSVTHTFKSVRTQTLTFQASGDNKTYGTGTAVQVTVETAKVTEVTVPASVVVGTETTITAKTQAGARYLQMCNAEGTVVKTWKAEGNSTVSGDTRTWSVTHTFKSVRTQTLTFQASGDNKTYGSGTAAQVTVTLPIVTSVTMPASTTAGADTAFTIHTSAGAQYVRMVNSAGTVVKVWSAEDVEVGTGGTKWELSFPFKSVRTQTLRFAASMDGTSYGEETAASITVLPVPTVLSVDMAATANEGTVTPITVRTAENAQVLRMCNTAGKTISTWQAEGSSTVEDGARVWSVGYTFINPNSHTLSFQSSTDGSAWSEAFPIALQVLPSVHSVTMPVSTLAGDTLAFTVRTSLAANTLTMVNQAGTAVKTWQADVSSAEEDGERVWSVRHKFVRVGAQTLSFRVKAGGANWSEDYPVTLRVEGDLTVLEGGRTLLERGISTQESFSVANGTDLLRWTVQSDGEWTAASGADWIGIERAGNVLLVRVLGGTDAGSRSCMVTVTVGDTACAVRLQQTVATQNAGTIAAPTSVTAEAVGEDGDVLVTWSGTEDAPVCRVWYGTSFLPEEAEAVLETRGVSEAVLTGLLPGTKYYVWVQAYASAEQYTWSTCAAVETPEPASRKG